MKFRITSILTAAIAGLALTTSGAMAMDKCAAGKTLENGVLTVATGNPAYTPWVIDDEPESGKGYESALTYELANRLGFEKDNVKWVRTTFDEAIQPGAKDFDFNIQQFSIRPEREKVVDFSDPYYTTAKAVVSRKESPAAKLPLTVSALKGVKYGAVAGQTTYTFVRDIIKPTQDMLLYDDNADIVAALNANQIEAAVFDLPIAMFLNAVQIPDGVVLGQFPAGTNDKPDQFGMLFAEGNPLRDCVNVALEGMKKDGSLAKIENEWLAVGAGIPLIEMK